MLKGIITTAAREGNDHFLKIGLHCTWHVFPKKLRHYLMNSQSVPVATGTHSHIHLQKIQYIEEKMVSTLYRKLNTR